MLGYSVYGQARGVLAGFGATHAIRHRVKTQARLNPDMILVIGPDRSSIGAPKGFETEAMRRRDLPGAGGRGS